MSWTFKICFEEVEMEIPVKLLIFSDRVKVEAALPPGYTVSSRGDGSYSIYLSTGPLVGRAVVEEEKVKFQYEGSREGVRLYELLWKMYPELIDNRIVWGVFYRWHDAWSYSGKPAYDTRGEALAAVTQFEIDKGAYLFSYRTCSLKLGSFIALEAYKIWDCGTLGRDESPVLIRITNQE